jgi:23S rRNA (uridine2552-2'-O)-methyltransferase
MSEFMSSKRWRDEHFNDPYVKKAQRDGYVCRAAYKLLEMNDKFNLIKRGMTIIDLGAAPGGWCQVAAKLVGKQGKVIGIDLLPLKAPVDVDFIQADFTDEASVQRLLQLAGETVDLVVSDMSPDLTGHKSTDQVACLGLVEMALDLALSVLSPHGVFLAKVFQGSGVNELVAQMRTHFAKVKIFKPKSSRSKSAEVYLVCLGFEG